MQIVMLLVVVAIIAFAALRQLGSAPDGAAEPDLGAETSQPAVPKLPMRPDAYQGFEQSMDRFNESAAEQQRRAIDAAAQ